MNTQYSTRVRRDLLRSAAAVGALSAFTATGSIARAATTTEAQIGHGSVERKVMNVLSSSGTPVTVERRNTVMLIGLDRPAAHNRIDPETYDLLAKAYFDYDQDPSLRAAVLFGHGPDFTRGIDVDAFEAAVASGKFQADKPGRLDPIARSTARLSKPLIPVSHGDTWNLGH